MADPDWKGVPMRNRRVDAEQSLSDKVQCAAEDLQSTADFVQSRAQEAIYGQKERYGCRHTAGRAFGGRAGTGFGICAGGVSAGGFDGSVPADCADFGLDALHGPGRVPGWQLCQLIEIEEGRVEKVSQSGGGVGLAAPDGRGARRSRDERVGCGDGEPLDADAAGCDGAAAASA